MSAGKLEGRWQERCGIGWDLSGGGNGEGGGDLVMWLRGQEDSWAEIWVETWDLFLV